MAATLRVALIGHGRFGRNHARVLHQLGALRVICDSFAPALDGVAAKYPDVTAERDFRRVLNAQDIDAVVIATPADSHFSFARDALFANKHVFVEKPITLDVGEAEELKGIAARCDRRLMVGHLLLYHPAVLKMAEIVQSGRLGRIYTIESSRRNLGSIRRTENVLWSFSPHDIAVFGMIMNASPTRVHCTGASFLHPDVEDRTTSTLFYDNGSLAEIYVSWLYHKRVHYIVVAGEQGVLEFADERGASTLTFLPMTIHNHGDNPSATRGEPEDIAFDRTEPLVLEDQHFLDCVQHGTAPRSDGANGVAVLCVLEALQCSLKSGGVPVALPSPKGVR